MSKGAGVGGGRSVPFRGSPNVPPGFSKFMQSDFMQSAKQPLAQGFGAGVPNPADMQRAQSQAYFQNQGKAGEGRVARSAPSTPPPQFMFSPPPPQQNYRTSLMPPPSFERGVPGNFGPMPYRSPGRKGGMGGGTMQPLPQNLGSPTMYMGMGSSPNYGVPSSMMPPQSFGYAGFNNGGLIRSGIGGFLG